MRPLFNGAGAAGLFCLSVVAAAVQAAEWNGSYSADGACYCSGKLDGAMARRMAPTPIGGQSIAQICERIGAGPRLTFRGMRFSEPVYLDAQCGNGPFVAGTRPASDSCAGSFDLAGKECVGVGPVWDMAAAYGSGLNMTAPAMASDSKSSRVRYVGGSAHAQTEDTINRSSGSVYRKVSESASNAVKGVVAANTLKEVDQPSFGAAREDTVSPANSAKDESLPIVNLGGVAYQLAPEGTPRKGGAPGSRIILDGNLYLKYVEGQMPTAVAAAKPEGVAATAGKGDPTKAAAREKMAREKVAARAITRKQSSAKKAEARQVRAAKAKAEKARLARLAESNRQASVERSGGGEEARKARTVKLLADARKRLQRRTARAEAEAAAQAEAQAQAEAAQQAAFEAQADTGATSSVDHGGALVTNSGTAPADSIEAKTGKLDPAQIAVAQSPAMSDEQSAMTSADTQRAVDETSAAVADNEASDLLPALVNAFRMPPETRTSSREFGYVDAMPINYAYGGGGVAFEASATSNDRVRLLARLGVASEYQEVLVGASVVMTPSAANRMTLVGTVGLEAGQFALEASDVSTTYDDMGVHVGVSSRLVLNGKFELQGGVGYSSFFGGDVTATGGGYYHLNRQLDIVSRFELGDNDSLGIGVRYYY